MATTDYTKNGSFPTKRLAGKEKVLAFMHKPTPFCATAGHFDDVTTGKPVESWSWGWFRCGGWQWSERDIYHVEKYDLELDPEFVTYALKY